MLLTFSVVINSNVNLSYNNLRYSCTALDAPDLYKIAKASNLSLMLVFCRYMGEVGKKFMWGFPEA